MNNKKIGVQFGLWSAALVAAVVMVSAQAPAVKRTVLQQGDISVAGREVVTARADFPAGAAIGRHSHPGDEVTYVVDGSLLLEIDGQPPRTVKAGEAFIVPAGRIHNATNKGSSPATVVANYIVEKGKPLTTPAR